MDAVENYDEEALASLICEQVTIRGLQPILEEFRSTRLAWITQPDAPYSAAVTEGLQQLFAAYTEEYHPGLDTLEFLLSHESADSSRNIEHIDEWEDIWYWVVQDNQDVWEEEFGADFDLEELEALYFAMYEAAIAEEGYYDEAYISPSEMRLLDDVALLLDSFGPEGSLEGFVAEGLELYRQHFVSDETSRDELAWIVADCFRVSAGDIHVNDDGELLVPGVLLIELLFAEGLQWDGHTEIADSTVELSALSVFSGQPVTLVLEWEKADVGYRVMAINSDWSQQLYWCLEAWTEMPIPPPQKEAAGGITADLAYVIERWFRVPHGLTFRFEVARQGHPIGSGEFSLQGLQWFQTLPEENAVGEKLWIHTLLTPEGTYIWNERLGLGVITPPCPSLLLIGDMLAVIPGGRAMFLALDGMWPERPDGEQQYPIPEVTIQDVRAISAVVWDYVWPFHHDPDIEIALTVAVSYPNWEELENGNDPRDSEPLWTEQLSQVSWYFDDQETRAYFNWEMLPGADSGLFSVPTGIEWDVWDLCPEPYAPPIWWEWGVAEAKR